MTYNELSEQELVSITDLQAELLKLEANMRTAETDAAAQKVKLGEYFYNKHEQGEKYEESAESIINAIKELYDSVNAMKNDVEAIQKETQRRNEEIKRLAEEAARKQEEAAAALAAANAMKNITPDAQNLNVVCKKCGSILFMDAKFCAECGTPVIKDEPKAAAGVCTKCGASLESGARFCAECGSGVSAVTAAVRTCAKCGAKLEEGARFCAECGTPG